MYQQVGNEIPCVTGKENDWEKILSRCLVEELKKEAASPKTTPF
jgi:hypothetical protein